MNDWRSTPLDDGRGAPASPGSGHASALPRGLRMGEFEIERVLGEGGFGIVYLAQDVQLGRPVAIKEYMPSSLAGRAPDLQVTVKTERHRATFELGRRSFINEARLLAQFDHPALVKVLRYWEDRGTAYMAMPFYRARTLKDTLAQRPPHPEETWLRSLWLPMLEALEHLHAAHCYHRDIAPDNILLPPSGTPILIDFGAARQVIGDATQALTVILKPGFAPIEQYAESGAMRQGPWTDIYALGAVMYHAVTGVAPPAAVARLVADEMRPAAELGAGLYSPGFLRCIDACLAVHPQARPASVRDVRLALEGQAELPRTKPGPRHAAEPDEDTVILPPGAARLPPSGPAAALRPSLPPSRPLPSPAPVQALRDDDFVADLRPERPRAAGRAWRGGAALGLLAAAGLAAWVAWTPEHETGARVASTASAWWQQLAPPGAGAAPAPTPARETAPDTAPPAALGAAASAAPAGPPDPPPAVVVGRPVPEPIPGGLIGPALDGPAALMQAHGGADTRWLLQATLERQALSAGRPLPLKLRATGEGLVYLLQTQPGSRVVELLASPRPVQAGAPARPGAREGWTVRGQPGPRQLLVIVSAVPRRFEPEAGTKATDAAWDVTRLGGDAQHWPGQPQCPSAPEPCDTRFAAALIDYEVLAPRAAPEGVAGPEADPRALSKIVLPRSYEPGEMAPPALVGDTVVRRPRPEPEGGAPAPGEVQAVPAPTPQAPRDTAPAPAAAAAPGS